MERKPTQENFLSKKFSQFFTLLEIFSMSKKILDFLRDLRVFLRKTRTCYCKKEKSRSKVDYKKNKKIFLLYAYKMESFFAGEPGKGRYLSKENSAPLTNSHCPYEILLILLSSSTAVVKARCGVFS